MTENHPDEASWAEQPEDDESPRTPPHAWSVSGSGLPGARHADYAPPSQDVSGQPRGYEQDYPADREYQPEQGYQPVQGYQPGPEYQSGPLYQTAMMPVEVAQPGRQQRTGVTAGLVIGIALLALLAGGLAGGVGAYLVSEQQSTTVSAAPNALDAPKPARQTSTSEPGSVQFAAEKLLPSVVELQVDTMDAAGKGSGVVFSSDGMILTNNHVVSGGGNGEIVAKFHDGQTAPASIVGTDPTSDLAVVKVSGVSGLTPAEFGRSDDLDVGQTVIAAGSPFELSNTVTSGIVSALHRPVRAGGDAGGQVTVLDAIQTDAPINPGNSGGPLVNTSGEVVGINSAIYSPPQANGLPGAQQQAGNVGLGFAIPVDQARRVGNQLAKTGQATQAMLQVTVTDARQDEGALIVEVNRGGAAERAGVRTGSVVVQANNRRIDSSDALIALVHSYTPGTEVQLTFDDGNKATVTLAGSKVGG